MRSALIATRYVLPAVVVLVGLVFVAIDPAGNWEGAACLIGAGLSISLLNFLHRVGVDGDRARDSEAAQRRYFDQHGHWPDEERR
jgi:hypothetical protein